MRYQIQYAVSAKISFDIVGFANLREVVCGAWSRIPFAVRIAACLAACSYSLTHVMFRELILIGLPLQFS